MERLRIFVALTFFETLLRKMTSSLDKLRQFSHISADTGDFGAVAKFNPGDLTTNPSLVLQLIKDGDKIAPFIKRLQEGIPSKITASSSEKKSAHSKKFEAFQPQAIDHLFAIVVVDILSHIKGKVSVEVPAHLNFSKEKTFQYALGIVKLIEDYGKPLKIGADRIYIKVAATWQGVEAVAQLEKMGITCNVTLIFSTVQALRCMEVGAAVISPFVGRLTDWHKKQLGVEDFSLDEDPGVVLVRNCVALAKKGKYSTRVLAASFRKADQILALAGTPILTISPALLSELASSQKDVELWWDKLGENYLKQAALTKVTEEMFYYQLSRDLAAVSLLFDGIRRFDDDYKKLAKEVDLRIH